ncbi:hypothetical protein [Tolypothrix sp. VBCCA 56010]|uniref:hypothetical protein n=1 Tax=Tolypothrix sp. VBCCA 56010 TaxID=3137731 RepID=UPI003D7DE8AB
MFPSLLHSPTPPLPHSSTPPLLHSPTPPLPHSSTPHYHQKRVTLMAAKIASTKK